MGQPAAGITDCRTVRGDEPPGQCPRGLRRHLLTEHHPDRQFRFVDGARNALAGRLADEFAQRVVRSESLVNGLGVGVQVEQPATACDGDGQVPEVVERQHTPHLIGSRRQADDPGAVRQPSARR